MRPPPPTSRSKKSNASNDVCWLGHAPARVAQHQAQDALNRGAPLITARLAAHVCGGLRLQLRGDADAGSLGPQGAVNDSVSRAYLKKDEIRIGRHVAFQAVLHVRRRDSRHLQARVTAPPWMDAPRALAWCTAVTAAAAAVPSPQAALLSVHQEGGMPCAWCRAAGGEVPRR